MSQERREHGTPSLLVQYRPGNCAKPVLEGCIVWPAIASTAEGGGPGRGCQACRLHSLVMTKANSTDHGRTLHIVQRPEGTLGHERWLASPCRVWSSGNARFWPGLKQDSEDWWCAKQSRRCQTPPKPTLALTHTSISFPAPSLPSIFTLPRPPAARRPPYYAPLHSSHLSLPLLARSLALSPSFSLSSFQFATVAF